MTLPYLLRLLCLCFSFFFLLNALGAITLRAFAQSALRFAETRRSAIAANFLFVVRLLPFALAALFVLFLSVPSYLRLEPAATAERAGWLCIFFGLLGFAACAHAIARATRALFLSLCHHRRFARQVSSIYVRETPSRIVVLETDAPLLALSGVFHPRLLVSRSILQALSSEELDAALSHEHAHHVSRDNFKRLLLLLTPDVIPFLHLFHPLEHYWSKFTEWAADDAAAAGNSQRALSLAAALVRVARLGAAPPLPVLATSLLASDADLRARVDRLLHPSPTMPSASPTHPWLHFAALLSVLSLTALLFTPTALHFIHELQELLLH